MFSDEALKMLVDRLAPMISEKITLRPVVEKRVYTVEEAAVYLGRTAPAVRILESRGKLRGTRPDGHLGFDVRDLNRWIEDGKQAR